MNEPVIHTDHAPGAYPLGLCAAGYHAVLLVDEEIDAALLGRRDDDFCDAALLFLAPGRAPLFARALGACRCVRMLAFDTRAFRCAPIAVDDYACFGYDPAESLHLSACERRVVVACMEDIRREAARAEDRFSCRVLSQRVRLLLDHGARIHERQLITREEPHRRLLARYEGFVAAWFESGRMAAEGAPSEVVCAAAVGVSPAYFASLLRFERGCTHAESVQRLRLEAAKRMLRAGRSVCEIACLLGFASEARFVRYFRRVAGCSPGEYRAAD